MAVIRVIGESLYQWSSGNKLLISLPKSCADVKEKIKRVDFESRSVQNEAGQNIVHPVNVYEENGRLLADIPNIFLQSTENIIAYVVAVETDSERTILHREFEIEPKTKPPNYVYEETEIKNYEALEARIKALEEREEISFEIEGSETIQEFHFTDDENGNVTIVLLDLPITDDGKGNITITSSQLCITEDGSGNFAITF